MLQVWVSQHSAAFLLDLLQDPIVGPDVRARLLAELERGRAYLVFHFTLKLSLMMEPPWVCFAIGHPCPAIARDACRRCLACTSTHSLITELQSEPLLDEAEQFVGWGSA